MLMVKAMLKASYLPTYFGLPLLDVITYVQIPTYCENYVESYLPISACY